MSFSIRLNSDEENLAKSYAKIHGCSVGEAFKRALFEKIEEEYDVTLAEQAHNDFINNPQTISHGDLLKEFDL